VSTLTAAEPQEPWIGLRGRIGVVIPATNIAVEYDCGRIRAPGLSWHYGRFLIPDPDLSSNGSFVNFLEGIRATIPPSIEGLVSAEVSHIMMGMSAETFWGGVAGNEEFVSRIRDQIGNLGLTTGANAIVSALGAFNARKIAVLTPYQPVGDEQVKFFFADSGIEVVRIKGLRCGSATSIAHTPRQDVIKAIVEELDGDDIDAIVQVGTNLSTSDSFPTLELQLGKPCIPINMATVWHALRAIGINDQWAGYGRLLGEH